ncbi:hypothetical protein CYMTET_52379 [Cymbomonas tetramitiformis]|uniref:Uncharacterized protein n=1 Tax=Cymbomonas tetramitiformis TaxID=36881 RepID=A0AAE0BKA7_9CHLO|nr:hypothetical protein CYMTET_52379 [Cymbomonas tetramitiformis]|eukprot:gene23443-28379_t
MASLRVSSQMPTKALSVFEIGPTRPVSASYPVGPMGALLQFSNPAVIFVYHGHVDVNDFFDGVARALGKYPQLAGTLSRDGRRLRVQVQPSDTATCRIVHDPNLKWNHDNWGGHLTESNLKRYARQLHSNVLWGGKLIDITLTFTHSHSIVGICFNHAVADGATLNDFIRTIWSKSETSDSASSVVHESAAFPDDAFPDDGSPTRELLTRPKRYIYPDFLFVVLWIARCLWETLFNKQVAIYAMYSAATCRSLKMECRAQGASVSTLDILSAHVWREQALLRYATTPRCWKPEYVHWCFYVDLRRAAQCDELIAGNPMALAVVSKRLTDLMEDPPQDTADLIRKEIILVRDNASSIIAQGRSVQGQHALGCVSHEVMAENQIRDNVFFSTAWTGFDFASAYSLPLTCTIFRLQHSSTMLSGIPGMRWFTVFHKSADGICSESIIPQAIHQRMVAQRSAQRSQSSFDERQQSLRFSPAGKAP